MLEALVKLCIPVANTIKKLYKRTKRRLRTIDEVEEEYFPGFKAFIDSRTRDPKAKEQKKGEGRAATTLAKRRKKYTIIKTQYIMVNGEGTILPYYYLLLHKTGHDRGRIHRDYEIFKNKIK